MSVSQKRRRRSRRSAFTLLELLLVMAILVVLASLSTVAVLSLQANAYTRAAYTDVTNLANACQMYKLNVGRFPAQLSDLHQMPSGLTQAQWQGPYLQQPVTGDPWNQDYVYQPLDAENRVVITSNGPDGQAGTEDDVSNAQ